MFDLGDVGMSVSAQEVAIARLDAVSRLRALSRRESAALEELLRRQAQRARKRSSRLARAQTLIEAQLAQLIGPFAGQATA